MWRCAHALEASTELLCKFIDAHVDERLGYTNDSTNSHELLTELNRLIRPSSRPFLTRELSKSRRSNVKVLSMCLWLADPVWRIPFELEKHQLDALQEVRVRLLNRPNLTCALVPYRQ